MNIIFFIIDEKYIIFLKRKMTTFIKKISDNVEKFWIEISRYHIEVKMTQLANTTKNADPLYIYYNR